MMIRINLLPVRATKKRETGQQILVLFAAVLVLAGVANYLWYSSRDNERQKNADTISNRQQRIKELEKVIGEVNNINKRKKEVEDKLQVLDSLRKGRSGPVKMMDALATATPKKVWLREFEEKGNSVKILGSAISHDDVAEFMRSLGNVVWTPKGMGRLVEQKREAKLERVELLAQEGAIEDFDVSAIAPFFTGIDLKKAQQKDGKSVATGEATKIVDFEIGLTCNYAI